MDKGMSKALTLMGAALLRNYVQDWRPKRRMFDRLAEDMTSSNLWSFSRVQGGEPVPQQEAILYIKETNRDYQEIIHKIEKMESILNSLSEEDFCLIDFHHWRGIEVREISEMMHLEQRSVYRRLRAIELKIGSYWTDMDVS